MFRYIIVSCTWLLIKMKKYIHCYQCSSVECTVMTLQIILHKFVFVHPLFPIVTNCKVNSQKMPYVFRFLTFWESANTKRLQRAQRGYPPYTPYSIGNSSQVIFNTTDLQGDSMTANHIARMCSAWMTHAESHTSFTK